MERLDTQRLDMKRQNVKPRNKRRNATRPSVRWRVGALVLACAVPSAIHAQDTSPAPAPRSILQASPVADVKAHSVGDVVTILVVERTSASNASRTSAQNQSSYETRAEAGTGLLSFVPDLAGGIESSRNQDGSGQVRAEGRFNTTLAAVVTEVRPNGDLVVAAQRQTDVNGQKELVRVTGIVRPADISPENVVLSTDVADAQIQYEGKGVVTKGSKPNIIVRLFSWIF